MGLTMPCGGFHISKLLTDSLSGNKMYRRGNVKRKTNYRKFLLLWSGELVSAIGGGLTGFGLSVHVFQKREVPAWLVAFGLLPKLLMSVPAGVIADRHDRRLHDHG